MSRRTPAEAEAARTSIPDFMKRRGVSSSPGEFDDFIKVQLGKWGKMVKDAGIQPE